jgi:parallel beta-helix repeat protein
MQMGDYSIIDGVTSVSNSMANENGISPTWSNAIRNVSNTGGIIRNCIVHDNWGEGIVSALAADATIEDNISYDNQLGIYVRNSTGVLVQRNLCYFTAGNPVHTYYSPNQVGYAVWDEGSNTSQDNTFINNIAYGGDSNLRIDPDVCAGNLFANNTFVNSIEATRANVYFYGALSSIATCRVTNNIILQDDAVIPIANNISTGIVMSYNLWSKAAPANMQGTGDVTGNPLLTGGDYKFAGYYKVKITSPAIEAGAVLGAVTDDYWQTERSGLTPDIGAHEYAYVSPTAFAAVQAIQDVVGALTGINSAPDYPGAGILPIIITHLATGDITPGNPAGSRTELHNIAVELHVSDDGNLPGAFYTLETLHALVVPALCADTTFAGTLETFADITYSTARSNWAGVNTLARVYVLNGCKIIT